MQIKTILKYHIIPVRMAITTNKRWRGCGKRKPSFSGGGNVNWYSHHGEQYGSFWGKKNKKTKLKIQLTYDPTIPLPVQMIDPYVYSSTIHSRQDMGTTYMSIDG